MITTAMLSNFKKAYDADKTNKAVQHAISSVGLQQASLNQEAIRKHNHQFSVKTKRGAITNQKSSGRCWMFSALNTARVNTMQHLNLETFEFSQAYPLFFDKLEKSNYFLESIIETRHEALDSRLVQHLLTAPIQDGGQWDMFSGLLEKYGAVPKSVMPETFHSSNTMALNGLLTSKLREFAFQLRNEKDESKLASLKEEQLAYVYQFLVKCLGDVPTTFTFEGYDKDGKFFRFDNMTPQQFFRQFVGWDLGNKISLIHAPQKSKPFNKLYTVKFLGSVKELYPIRYVNVEIDVLKQAAIKSLQAGEPVWFGCDVGKLSDRTHGILDLDTYDYENTIHGYSHLSKGDKLDYGDSLLTHAMVFTGVNLDNDGKPLTWQVENSWGDAIGDKGMFSMSDAWFDEFTYQITVDKKYVDEAIVNILNSEVIELEPWDPMGALALVK